MKIRNKVISRVADLTPAFLAKYGIPVDACPAIGTEFFGRRGVGLCRGHGSLRGDRRDSRLNRHLSWSMGRKIFADLFPEPFNGRHGRHDCNNGKEEQAEPDRHRDVETTRGPCSDHHTQGTDDAEDEKHESNFSPPDYFLVDFDYWFLQVGGEPVPVGWAKPVLETIVAQCNIADVTTRDLGLPGHPVGSRPAHLAGIGI